MNPSPNSYFVDIVSIHAIISYGAWVAVVLSPHYTNIAMLSYIYEIMRIATHDDCLNLRHETFTH